MGLKVEVFPLPVHMQFQKKIEIRNAQQKTFWVPLVQKMLGRNKYVVAVRTDLGADGNLSQNVKERTRRNKVSERLDKQDDKENM